MPNYNTHTVVSLFTGAGYSLVVQKHREKSAYGLSVEMGMLHMLVCGAAGFVGGCIPDILEPANRRVGPDHRGGCHSLIAAFVAARSVVELTTWNEEHPIARWALDIMAAFCAGYLSHLAADCLTPRGLNFACKGF